MKPEHSEIIEAMAEAIAGSNHDDYMLLNIFEREPYQEDAIAALRAAAERGYRLAKLPDRMKTESEAAWAMFRDDIWNACLDAIETIKMEDGDG